MTAIKNLKFDMVSWSRLDSMLQKLAERVVEDNIPVDYVIGISRCGLPIGRIISDYLQLPVYTFGIKSSVDIGLSKKPIITEKLTVSVKNKNILLVDGTADSGKTLLLGIEYLKSLGAASIITATAFYKKHSIYKPDLFAEETNKWIVQPYEIIEFGVAIARKLKAKNLSRKDIYKHLKKYNFSASQFKLIYHFTTNSINKDSTTLKQRLLRKIRKLLTI